MSIVATERALTDLCAQLLELEIDRTIFRGRLPASKTDCVAVLINGVERGNEPVMVRYSARLAARRETRDAALELCDLFDRLFPCAEGGFYILKNGNPAVYDSTVDGREVSGVTVNLDVRLTQ